MRHHDEPSPVARFAPGVLVHDPRLPPPFLPAGRGGTWRARLTRILTVAAGTLVLIGAVAISFVVFAIALAVLLVIGLYLWWKSRHIRRQLAEQLNARRSGTPPPPGDVIEGEFVRKDESDPRQY